MLKTTIKRAAAMSAIATAGVIGFAGVASASSPSDHVVRSGETLSGIAGPDWPSVARADGTGSGTPASVSAPAASAEPAESAPAPEPAPAPAATSSSAGGTVWDRLAQCESSGNWSINTGNGYYGGLQFSQSSWNAAGGSGNPANASREEQIRVAENLRSMQGWGAWPSCSSQLGLR